MNSKELLEKLSAPFAADEIEWRAGSTNKEKTQALALAYINARSVMNRLDDVVGAEGWSDNYDVIPGSPRGYICTLSIKFGDQWISKSDGADESDFEAVKGGLSDAFKRAANKWGIGRYLYNLEAVWAPCQEYGRSVKITKVPQLPAWALPQKNKALDEFEKAQAAKTSKPAPAPAPANPNLGADWIMAQAEGKEKAAETETEKPVKAQNGKYTRPMSPETLKEALAIRAKTAKPASEKQTALVRMLLLEYFAGREDERHQAQEYLTGKRSLNEMDPKTINTLLDWMKPEKNPDGSGSYVISQMSAKELSAVANKFMAELGQESLL